MTDEREILEMERANVKRIERLEAAVSSIREDIAALPGKLRTMTDDRTWQWGFASILTVMGGVFLVLYQNDLNSKSELSAQIETLAGVVTSHTADGHSEKLHEAQDAVSKTRMLALEEKLKAAEQVLQLTAGIGREQGITSAGQTGRIDEALATIRTDLERVVKWVEQQRTGGAVP